MASKRARRRSTAANMRNNEYPRETGTTNVVRRGQRKVNRNAGGDSLGHGRTEKVVTTLGEAQLTRHVPDSTQPTRKGRKRSRISYDSTSRSQPFAKRGPGARHAEESTNHAPATKKVSESASAIAETIRRNKSGGGAKPRARPETIGKSPISTSFLDTTVPYVNPGNLSLERTEGGKVKVFGQGEYGYVVRGEFTTAGADTADVVVKYVKNGKSDLEEITHEARMLAYLSDTGCVPKVYGLLKDKRKKDEPAIVQECVGGGLSLRDVLKLKAAQSTWVKLCLQSAEALQKIHAKGALLNDIKPDNMMVDCSRVGNNVRFIDMGMASHKYGICYQTDPSMDLSRHLAPEVKRGGLTSELSDIYSLGKVIEDVGHKARNAQLYIIGQLMTFEHPTQRCSLESVINLLKDFANRLD